MISQLAAKEAKQGDKSKTAHPKFYGKKVLKSARDIHMLFSTLIFTGLSRDPAVPLFGARPYAYGEGEVEGTKYQMTTFGKGGQDKGCPDCMDDPPHTTRRKTGSWYIYNDSTWDFSADEPKKKPDCDLGKIFCSLPANKRPFLMM